MALEQAFIARNATVVGSDERADVYVLNSCTVTHAADADARKLARRFKRKNPDATVVVTGCYAQVSADDLAALPEIDAVVGNDGKHKLADLALGLDARSGPEASEAEDSGNKRTRGRRWQERIRPARSHITAMPESRTRPFLKVQDGCDYTCAFCIIPKARGVSRSIPASEVLDHALRYADVGARELVLTGIHLGHWGRDMVPRRPFHDLVAELAAGLRRDGRIARLRLGSVEPNEVTDELIALIRDDPTLCEHLHVPLQSGDDDVLKRMRRLYSSAQYAETIGRLRAALPDAAIGADVLVGHPGEDDAAFARTVAFVEGLDLSYLHVFPFSARRGTPAASMGRQVAPPVKSERVRTLVRFSDARRHFFHRRFEGRRLQAIALDSAGAGTRALTANYIPARIDATLSPGAVVDIVISRSGKGTCEAELAA